MVDDNKDTAREAESEDKINEMAVDAADQESAGTEPSADKHPFVLVLQAIKKGRIFTEILQVREENIIKLEIKAKASLTKLFPTGRGFSGQSYTIHYLTPRFVDMCYQDQQLKIKAIDDATPRIIPPPAAPSIIIP